jgi:hypothetical protein
MKSRCFNPNNVAYSYYGGRGVSVCPEWQNSFVVFALWATSSGYRDGLEIDRRNVNGDYEPGNCRWATRKQQMRNTRKRRDAKTSRYKGVSWCANVRKWRVQLHMNGRPIHCGLFDDEVVAAHCYDEMATRQYGEYAHLNFGRSLSS